MRTCAESRNWSTSFPNGFLAAAAPSGPQPAPPTSLSNRSMDAHQACHGTIERSECKIEAVLETSTFTLRTRVMPEFRSDSASLRGCKDMDCMKDRSLSRSTQ